MTITLQQQWTLQVSTSRSYKARGPTSSSCLPKRPCTRRSDQPSSTYARWDESEKGRERTWYTASVDDPYVQVFTHTRPDLFGQLWRYSDELYLVFESLLQLYFIRRHGIQIMKYLLCLWSVDLHFYYIIIQVDLSLKIFIIWEEYQLEIAVASSAGKKK